MRAMRDEPGVLPQDSSMARDVGVEASGSRMMILNCSAGCCWLLLALLTFFSPACTGGRGNGQFQWVAKVPLSYTRPVITQPTVCAASSSAPTPEHDCRSLLHIIASVIILLCTDTEYMYGVWNIGKRSSRESGARS